MCNFRENLEMTYCSLLNPLLLTNGKYLSGAILGLRDHQLMALRYGLCLLDKKLSSHLSFNMNVSKNHVQKISRTLPKRPWSLGKRSLFFKIS